MNTIKGMMMLTAASVTSALLLQGDFSNRAFAQGAANELMNVPRQKNTTLDGASGNRKTGR